MTSLSFWKNKEKAQEAKLYLKDFLKLSNQKRTEIFNEAGITFPEMMKAKDDTKIIAIAKKLKNAEKKLENYTSKEKVVSHSNNKPKI